MAIPMAVAQVESDKLTVTVREVASVYLLRGMIQLMTVTINLSAVAEAWRDCTVHNRT